MTEVAELVNKLDDMLTDSAENYCEYKEAKPKPWKCRISGLVGGEPTAKRLLESMNTHKMVIPEKPAPGTIGKGWDIEKCSRTAFPFQTHHLIPKKHLPTHKVCTWLTKKYKKHMMFELESDSNYDTDHANNGYCMPFVSTTIQWKKAGGDEEKRELAAFALMDKTGIQLHQGSHSYEALGEEEEGLETSGYLEEVDELLSRIHRACRRHVVNCKTCKKGDEKPNVQPVAGVVRHMDQASLILKLKIDARKIFVSDRAFRWARRRSAS